MNWIFGATEDDLDRAVAAASHERPIRVVISADWCAPYRVLSPVLERVIAEFGGAVHLAMVDADENMRVAGRHKEWALPTVIAYRGAFKVDRSYSAQAQVFVLDLIDRMLS